jgi:DNA-binding transcriptional ArsR family regulator
MRKSRTLQHNSVRQRVLRALKDRGPMGAHEAAGVLGISSRAASNALSGLKVAGAVVTEREGGVTRYRLAERRGYQPPPEMRIDIAGPVYARGYRWSLDLNSPKHGSQ